jgi:hypothetical protein
MKIELKKFNKEQEEYNKKNKRKEYGGDSSGTKWNES